MITDVRAFEGGSCRQLLAMVDRRSWRIVTFPAVFLALKHAREGWVLVDTGYGDQFFHASRRFPGRLYRWVTPVRAAGQCTPMLAHAGIDPDAVRHIVVTHFHADHVGGLAEFPRATLHHHADALEPLLQLPRWRQVKSAFLEDLVPKDHAARANVIAPAQFVPVSDLPFRTHDLFADGSIRLPELPGHAPGQVGVVWHGELYAADAYWRRCQIDEAVEPPGLAMNFQWDANAYRSTVDRLRKVGREGRFRVSACHDEGTCAHYARTARDLKATS